MPDIPGLGTLRSDEQLDLACRLMKLEVKDYTTEDLIGLNLRSKF